MFSLNPMKELYESPLPPMALTDYEAFSKFLNQALHCCHETGRDFNDQNSSVFLGRFDPTV